MSAASSTRRQQMESKTFKSTTKQIKINIRPDYKNRNLKLLAGITGISMSSLELWFLLVSAQEELLDEGGELVWNERMMIIIIIIIILYLIYITIYYNNILTYIIIIIL